MKSLFKKIIEKLTLVLLAVNILVGISVFRNYGLSWDEPLFYDYADALGYAYSPAEWFSGNFDIENSYGPSAEDHKTRGPAYLFLARGFVYGLNALSSDIIPAGDTASSWHLINFLFFQFGIYFLYRLSTRWMKPSAALAATAFFSYQPLLWGHAFINPKDPPFLVFFLATVCLGFEMVDALATNASNKTIKVLVAAFCLGIATSIRVLGPLAGLIVIVYALTSVYPQVFARPGLKSQAILTKPAKADSITPPAYKQFLQPLAIYILIAIAVMLITWPYLWENPIGRLFDTLELMSDNPTQLAVLFSGEVFRADDMPRRYLPFMLAVTLTEPTWFLFFIGIAVSIWKYFKNKLVAKSFASLLLIFSWFVILVGYVLIRQPAMYDGLRHFLFILPPVFIIAGFAFEWMSELAKPAWLRAGAVLLILLPGLIGIVRLHPYEYTYYNSFIGGTSGAFRQYETDYWLTCYKEAVEKFDASINQPTNLFVLREAYIAEYYSGRYTIIRNLSDAIDLATSGDFVLVNSRTNRDRSIFQEAPPVVQVRRGDAIFCEIRQIP